MGVGHFTGLDSLKAIALGRVPGAIQVIRFGRNPDVDATAAQEDIWNGGGVYTGFPTGSPETVNVFSSSTADAAAGTGLRTVRLIGLGSDFKTQTEDLTLNGTTAVTSTITWYRVNNVQGLTAGSGATNAGSITVRHTTTTANVFAVVPAGAGTSQIAAYTIPINRVGLLTAINVGASNAQQSAQEITATMAARTHNSGLWRHINTSIVTTNQPNGVRFDGGFLVQPLTDLAVRVVSATADSLYVTAEFEVFLFAI